MFCCDRNDYKHVRGQTESRVELIHLLLLFTFVTGKHESCFNNPLRAPARPTHLHTDTGGAAIVSLLCRLLNRVVRWRPWWQMARGLSLSLGLFISFQYLANNNDTYCRHVPALITSLPVCWFVETLILISSVFCGAREVRGELWRWWPDWISLYLTSGLSSLARILLSSRENTWIFSSALKL